MTSNDGGQIAEGTNVSDSTNNEVPKPGGIMPLKHKTISCTQCRKRKLKCDRGKPSCGTCSRLQHQCVYPEGRMKSTAKRRNVKDLEARLAQVESLLSSEVVSKSAGKVLVDTPAPEGLATDTGDYWDDLEMDMVLGDEMSRAANQSSSAPTLPPMIEDLYAPNELIGFGLQENLPPQEIADELHNIYFNRIHSCAPVVHKYRYLASAQLLPPLGPPVCLRYAIWAIAAAASDKFSNLQEVFYQRARRYAELDEMKGQGEHFITVSHAQCWSLISMHEAQTMYLSRAWASAGRCIRLVQMMNLHNLDGNMEDFKHIIAPPKDWIELEERRRTFWSAFCSDRYSCAGTGWPMTIDERDIRTNLPASEEAFLQGRMEVPITLSEAMTSAGAARVSPFAGVVLMACLFGHNWIHLHRLGPNDHPEDFLEGEFWKRHRRMDNVLSNTAMFLPDRLRLPAGLHDPNIVYLNMNIHASTICLHQSAVLKADKHGLDARIIKQSQARCRTAALEIVNIMRLISHFNVSEMNPWVSFNLYIAASVLIEGCRSQETGEESRSNLDFLLQALQALGRKQVVTQAFIAQLKIDLEIAGIKSPFPETVNRFGSTSSTSVYDKEANSRVTESPVDFPEQFIFLTGSLPSTYGGSNNCSTSEKDSATPHQDLHDTSDLLGVFPKHQLTERLRKTQAPFKTGKQGEQNVVYGVPNTFNIPALYPLFIQPGPKNKVHLQSEITSASGDGDPSSFAALFQGQQQFMQPSLGGSSMQKNPLGSYPTAAAADDNDFSNWALGPMDASVPTGSAGFNFSLQEGEDINSLLNGAAWEDPVLFRK